ncbi:hypothetical protein D3C78_1689150 [compost metagenome]
MIDHEGQGDRHGKEAELLGVPREEAEGRPGVLNVREVKEPVDQGLGMPEGERRDDAQLRELIQEQRDGGRQVKRQGFVRRSLFHGSSSMRRVIPPLVPIPEAGCG